MIVAAIFVFASPAGSASMFQFWGWTATAPNESSENEAWVPFVLVLLNFQDLIQLSLQVV
jgi:hypothetical protein